MKKLYTLFFLALFCNCESGTKLQDTDFEVGVISGEVTYLDVLTDEIISDNEEIQIELNSIGSEPVNIPIGINKKINGFQFEFGPLKYGMYSVESKYEDSNTGVDYFGEATVDISSTNIRQVLEIALEPQNQTIIIGELLNKSASPVLEADLFLYNDTTFLKQFKGTGGFVDKGQSNKLGRALFSGHQEGEYYVLGRLIIEEDTLFSRIDSLVPTIVLPSDITKVQSLIEIE